MRAGIYGKNIFPQHDGGNWQDPNANYVKTPSLTELRDAFTPDACFDSYQLEWTSGKDGQLYVNTAPFFVKGACVRACVRAWMRSEFGRVKGGAGSCLAPAVTCLAWPCVCVLGVTKRECRVIDATSPPISPLPMRSIHPPTLTRIFAYYQASAGSAARAGGTSSRG